MRGGGEANLKVYHGSRHGPWWHDHAVSLPWGALDLYLLTCGTVQQRRPRVREELDTRVIGDLRQHFVREVENCADAWRWCAMRPA